MKRRLTPYLQPHLGPSPGVAVTPGLLDPNPVLPAGLLVAADKRFTQLETSKIQAACGLSDAQWQTDLLELYPWMLQEGRTTAKVRALLEDEFRPDNLASLNVVYITATDDMARDIKEINFGFNGLLSFKTCHLGISPFRLTSISMATHTRRRPKEERVARATHLTYADLQDINSTPDVRE
jgi:hypothetical protein